MIDSVALQNLLAFALCVLLVAGTIAVAAFNERRARRGRG